MALTIKGTPQPISEMTASLQDISKDAPAKAAVKAAMEQTQPEKKDDGAAR